jgi:transposase
MTKGELGRVLAVAGRQGRGRRFPRELRQRAVEYCRQRRSGGGVTWQTLQAELGVSSKSLMLWTRREGKAAFHPMEIQRVEVQRSSAQCVLHGPFGIRVEGLTLADVAELIRRLG